MAYRIIVPNLGTIDDELIITKWHRSVGETVTRGEPLVEVETLKADYVIEAEESGTLRAVYFREGETAGIRNALGVVAGPDEPLPIGEPDIVQTKPEAIEPHVASGKNRVKASPAARRKARELGLDIETLSGRTGGTITLSDLPGGRAAGESTPVVIVGALRFGVEMVESIEYAGRFEIRGFLDDDKKLWNKAVGRYSVIGPLEAINEMPGVQAVVAVSGAAVRSRIFDRLKKMKAGIAMVVDTRAIVTGTVVIHDGAVIKAGAIIAPGVVIGEGAIIDIGVAVAHDNMIGKFAHLAPGCRTGGSAVVGDGSLVGVGASVASEIKIGRDVIITPGTAVLADVPDGVVVSGHPGKIIGKRRKR